MKKQMLFLILLFFAVLIIPVGTQTINVSVGYAETQDDLALACEPEPPESSITYYDDKITIKLMYEDETIVLAWEDWTEEGQGEMLPDLEGLERIEFIYAWGKAGFDFEKGYTFFSPEPDGPDLVKLTYILDSEIDGESYTSHILFFEANPHDIEVDYMRWYGGEPYSLGPHTNIWLWFDEADSSVQVMFYSAISVPNEPNPLLPYEFKFQGVHGDPIFIEENTGFNQYVLDLHSWGADIYSATGWLDDIELEDHLGAFFFEPYTYHAPIYIGPDNWDEIVEEFDGKGTRKNPLKITGLYFDNTDEMLNGIFINNMDPTVENAYIDIEDCLFNELNEGVHSEHSSGRLKIKDCIFYDNKIGVYLEDYAQQIVEDCVFYEGWVRDWTDDVALFLQEAYDVTVKECTFYNYMRNIFIEYGTSASHVEINDCNIYSNIHDMQMVADLENIGIQIQRDANAYDDGIIVIRDIHIEYCAYGILIGPGAQGVVVKNNEISHCPEPIWIQNGASFNTITDNYVHDTYLEQGMFYGMLIQGHYNIIKSNKFENFEEILCYTDSYENEITWNVFLETIGQLAKDYGEDNIWDFNYYSDYEGDGKEPYDIGEPELRIQDLHPLGPEVPYIPPTPPDRTDYTYHTSIEINAETWEEVIEEFDGMGTLENPLKIKGFYFEGQFCGVKINNDLENVYIDIEDCLFIGYSFAVLSYPLSGRIKIKDCVFIENSHGVFLGEYAEQIVKDCMFYGGSYPYGSAVLLEQAYDVTVTDCTFYAVERGVYATWFGSSAHLEIDRCDIYGGRQNGIHIVGYWESSHIGISKCNIYNSDYGIYAFNLEVENCLIDIDECSIYDGIYGIYFDGVKTGPNGVVLIHNSEIGWGDDVPQSTAIYLTGGSSGIVIEDNNLHHCEYGIWFRQYESYNRINRNKIEYCRQAIFIQGLSSAYEARCNVISDNEIAHISHEAVWFFDYTSDNIFTGNYLHDNEIGDAEQWNMFICGHHNIIKSNKFENVGAGHVAITLYFIDEICYENEITWNVFLDTNAIAISDESGVNILDFNYYTDYDGDGREPYVNHDLHPLGPEVPYIPPTPPDRTDYTYHASIRINAETWDEIVEEFEGMGTQESPLKIKGLYFEDTGGIAQSRGVFINTDVEDAYIDIEDCLFMGYHSYAFIGILSYPSSGRIRIKDCVFIDNNYAVYLSEHAEQIVEDCLFYGGSLVGGLGAGVFLEEAFDVVVKHCTFYAVEEGILAEWLSPTSRFEIHGCNIYSGTWGIDIHGSDPGADGAIIIRDNHIDYSEIGIEIGQGSEYSPGSQGVIVKYNEISHCEEEAISIQSGASFNTITNNYIHDILEESVLIEGDHNIIKSNKFEAVGISIYCDVNSYENEITWNVFLDTFTTFLVADTGEGNLWDYNYYSDYEGDGTEPYDITNWSEGPENQDLHPLGPELTFSYWWELLLQYPLEVLRMLIWLI